MREQISSRATLTHLEAQSAVGDSLFWHSLIDEGEAARFLGFTVRCLQGWRYRGGGPRYIKINARNVRYRRADLRDFAEARLRTSTSDTGPEAA